MNSYYTLTYNPFGVNTYVICNEQNECLIVDAACYDKRELEHLYNFIEGKKLKIVAAVNTHGHFDHLFGVDEVCSKYNLTPYIHQDDMYVVKAAAELAIPFGLVVRSLPPKWNYFTEDGMVSIGGFNFRVMQVPGHSKGSVVLYFEKYKILVTGDVLFAGSIGRTDLPGGSYIDLISGIKSKILNLPLDTVVLPGHGPSTTIGEEISSNSFLNYL
ncbi:MAG TPA: MBL fold metallo-hydrolase [Bacteroidales bacterium]|nr:MBL fold metallo-hydrolase [Bacteroidales bacterium]